MTDDLVERSDGLTVGLLGCGNVGGGVARILADHADRIAARVGAPERPRRHLAPAERVGRPLPARILNADEARQIVAVLCPLVKEFLAAPAPKAEAESAHRLPGWLGQALIVTRKDLLIELRTGEVTPTRPVFALLAVVLATVAFCGCAVIVGATPFVNSILKTAPLTLLSRPRSR